MTQRCLEPLGQENILEPVGTSLGQGVTRKDFLGRVSTMSSIGLFITER